MTDERSQADQDVLEVYGGVTAEPAADDVWRDEEADGVQGDVFADDGVWADDGERPDETPTDPLVRPLIIVILLMVIIILVTAGMLFIFLGSLNNAPRTTAERDVTVWEAAVQERPKDSSAWSALAYAYARAGRFDEALEAVKKGQKYSQKPYMAIVKADVLRAARRHKEALVAYDEAEKKATAYRDTLRNERLKLGITSPPDDNSLALIYLGRGLTKDALGDVAGAVKDLEASVKEAPEQAKVSALLGDEYVKAGDVEKAKAAYRAALKYVPDLPEALEGLKRIEGSSK